MNWIETLGLVAAFFTTASFLPQVYKTWKTKHAENLSMAMLSALFIGVTLWLIYGFLISSVPIIASNFITVISSLLLIYFKRIYTS